MVRKKLLLTRYTDPYYTELPDGSRKRRKLPDYCSTKEKKIWKKLQNRAWKDDRCLCGCLWVNWGLGLAPILSILPTIGPIIMYMVHSKLISMADKELNLPPELLVKLHGNIVLDLLISLPPILGTFLAWMNACSTRNCALIYNYMVKRASQKYAAEQQRSGSANQNPLPVPQTAVRPQNQQNARLQHQQPTNAQQSRQKGQAYTPPNQFATSAQFNDTKYNKALPPRPPPPRTK